MTKIREREKWGERDGERGRINCMHQNDAKTPMVASEGKALVVDVGDELVVEFDFQLRSLDLHSKV